MGKTRLKPHVVTIEVLDEQWDFNKGDKLDFLVYSINKSKAVDKFEDENCGSEYPPYRVVDVKLMCNIFPFRQLV